MHTRTVPRQLTRFPADSRRCVSLSACQDLVTPEPKQPEPAAALVGQAVPGRYIVVLAPGLADVAAEAAGLAAPHQAQVIFVYEYALRGFAAQMSAAAAGALARNPRVRASRKTRSCSSVGRSRPRRRGGWTAWTSATCRSAGATRGA